MQHGSRPLGVAPQPAGVGGAREIIVRLRDRRTYAVDEVTKTDHYVEALARRRHRDLLGVRYYPPRRVAWSWSEIASVEEEAA